MFSPSESPVRAEGLLERELSEFLERVALRECVLLVPAASPAPALSRVRPGAG